MTEQRRIESGARASRERASRLPTCRTVAEMRGVLETAGRWSGDLSVSISGEEAIGHVAVSPDLLDALVPVQTRSPGH